MDTVQRARHELNLLRGFIRRTGTTGWVERTAKHNYRAAFKAVVNVEDEIGVEHPTAIALSERLQTLRDEARAAGLLANSELLAAEREAMNGGS